MEMMDGNATDESNPDAMQKLGQRSRSLIQVIQKLSAFNIDTTLPSLPKIILVGDQSAGKSSVIEALCDITMPRNEGTCTRCPFMLTTTSSVVNSSAWTCTISIMNKFAFVRSVRAGQDGEIYDYWQKQKEAASVQFAVIYRKEDLEQALRRAQLAILNPGRDCHDFSNLAVDTRQKQKTQVAFSPNVVCLEIASPNLPELSFYDLPGAINSMSDPEDQYLVDFVSTLLKSYINDEKATVLLACAANQDIETSTSIRYLTESRTSNGKARGDSVLGVLTKPDLVDDNPEKIAGIGNIMGGGVFRMDYGWFVTKQLSQKQLSQGISHEKARKAETEFFAGGPWANDLATYQTRFGTENLQNALSKILTSHILEELPGIVARVKGRLSEVDQALATFPAQDAAPTIAIIQEVDAVKTAILAQLNADAMSSFRTAYREVARDIQKGLIECQPIVDLSTPGYVKKSISIDDSSDEESPSKKAKVKSTQREYSVAPSRTPVPKSVNSSNQNSADRRRKLPAGNAAAPRAATRANFNLKDVQRDFDSAPGADLPGGTSDLVTRALILKTLCGFRSVSNKSLQTVKAVFLRMLNDTLNTALAARRATDLFKKASRIVRALFDELMAEESAIISRIITRENYRPISHSSEAIRMKRKQHSTELQARRLKHRVLEHFETLESEGQKVNGPDVEKKSRDPVWAQANLGKFSACLTFHFRTALTSRRR